MGRRDITRCLTALALCLLAIALWPSLGVRAQGGQPQPAAPNTDVATPPAVDDSEEWVEFEDGHTGEIVRAPARDQRPPPLPVPVAEVVVPEVPPDDSVPIMTPMPTDWVANDGSQCRRRRRHRFCDGPRRVPEPHGEAAALATRLHLGTRAGQYILEHAPRPEWVAEARGRLSTSMRWPVDGGSLWRGLVARRGRRPEHTGVDIGAREGTLVLAANDGLVVYANNDITGYGNMVTVVHSDGSSTMYAHLRAAYVFPGMHVHRAQVLGEVGNTGISQGPHLHFEWRIDGIPLNPLPRFIRVPPRAEARLRQLEAER